jgi:hypothetical protein
MRATLNISALLTTMRYSMIYETQRGDDLVNIKQLSSNYIKNPRVSSQC